MERVGMSELKPCPFCGGEAEIKRREFMAINHQTWYVRCRSNERCYANSQLIDFPTESEAIEAWNRRANDGER